LTDTTKGLYPSCLPCVYHVYRVSTVKLTKTSIEKLPTPATAPAFYRDDEIRGFGIKVFSSGVKTFFLEKGVNGKVKRITIGRYGELTAEQARKQAQKLAGEIATGVDPVAKKRRAKLEEKNCKRSLMITSPHERI